MSHRFKTLSQAALVCLIAVSSAPTFAADGIGKAPQYPNLCGQKAAYI
jgi:hypothetical protein